MQMTDKASFNEELPVELVLPPGFRELEVKARPMTGHDVRVIQQVLQDKGFYSGPVHGVFDDLTAEALIRFQEENSMEATGKADVSTWIRLGVLIESDGKLVVSPEIE